MVHALQEARRILADQGVLVDVRPVVSPIVLDVVIASQSVWTRDIAIFSSPEDIAAADSAVQHSLSLNWFSYDKNISFDFDIYCDTAAELDTYVNARKLRGEEIPYDDLEARLREFEPDSRLRCRRRWMLSTYRKK